MSSALLPRSRLAGLVVLAVVSAALLCTFRPACAGTSLQVVATDPPSPAVLGQWGEFALHIAYSSDRPILISARPFFRGQRVPAMNGGSPRRDAGTGEVLLWFAFTDSRRVDSVVVTAEAQSGVVAETRIAVDLAWTGQPNPTTRVKPEWVGRLQAEQASRLKAQSDAFMNGPESWVLDALGLGVMLGVPGYFILQVALLVWLRDGWRRAAALPLVPMALVLAYTVWAFAQGSNLFPIVLIFTAPLAFAYLIILAAARRTLGKPA